MKYKFLKSFFLITSGFLILIMAGCVKEKTATFTDFSTTSDFVVLQNSGLPTFKASNINTSSGDTVRRLVRVDLASANSSNGPVTVNLGLNNAVIVTYNAANGTAFQTLPAGSYKILSPILTIPAGQHYAETTVEFYSKKFDPSVSYLLPVSIVDASGKALSSNLNTIYYNIIGNPLAGVYTWDFTRFNSSDTTGARNGSSFTGRTIAASPLSATSLLFPDSYTQTFISPTGGYVLSFDNTGGVLSNFKVALDPQTVLDIPANSFTLAAGPKLLGYTIVGSAATKYAGSTFRFYISYINSGGNPRTLIDNFVKQ